MENTKQSGGVGFYYGWWIVTACSMIGLLSMSSRFSFTMFFPTLIDDLGWTRAQLGFGLTLHMWIYAVSAVVAGYFVDKYGARVIMCLGGLLILVGLSFTSTMTRPWQFYLYYGVILAVGVAFSFVVPILGTVRKWFIKKAGVALALTNVGAGLGGALMAVVIPGMLASFGWRRSWFYLGMVLGVSILILAGILIRKNPESMGLLPDGEDASRDEASAEVNPQGPQDSEEIWTVSEAMRTKSFWCFIIGGCLSAIPAVGITGHIANWGMDIARAADVSAADAMGSVKLGIALSALFAMVGAMIGGPLSDRIGRKPIILIGLAMDVAVFLYASTISSLSSFVYSVLFMGFCGGLVGPAFGAYVGDIFGRQALATIFSLIIFSIGIVGGTGAVIFGWIHDTSHSYMWAWFISAFCMTVTVVLYSLTRKEIKKGPSDT